MTTIYAYQGRNILYEKIVENSTVTKHVYAGMRLIADVKGGAVKYYHQDHLGSTRLITDSTGSIVFSSNYRPFGSEYALTGSASYKYTGKRKEEGTGLYYFGFRFYDPEVGRFISMDPLMGDLRSPQGLNRYVYAKNNQLRYVDPLGLDEIYYNVQFETPTGGVMGTAMTQSEIDAFLAANPDHTLMGQGANPAELYVEVVSYYQAEGIYICPEALHPPEETTQQPTTPQSPPEPTTPQFSPAHEKIARGAFITTKGAFHVIGAVFLEVGPPIVLPGVGIAYSLAIAPTAIYSIYLGFRDIQEGMTLIAEGWSELQEGHDTARPQLNNDRWWI